MYDEIMKRLTKAGIDSNEILFKVKAESVIPSIINKIGIGILLLDKEKVKEIFDRMPKALEWGLGMIVSDVLDAAVNNISTNITKFRVNGVDCHLVTERPLSRDGIEGYYVFDIRHDESGEPCTIEKQVFANYYGTILSPVNFLKNGEMYVAIE
mgnify:CR=1 FL=1